MNGLHVGSSGEAETLSYRFSVTGEQEVVVMDAQGELDRRTLQVE